MTGAGSCCVIIWTFILKSRIHFNLKQRICFGYLDFIKAGAFFKNMKLKVLRFLTIFLPA